MNPLHYFRYLAYAIFALGLINLRYQSGTADLAVKTYLIVGTGILIFALTYIKPGREFLAKSMGKIAIWILGIAVILFAILN